MGAVDFVIVCGVSILYISYIVLKFCKRSNTSNCIDVSCGKKNFFDITSSVRMSILSVFIFLIALRQSYLNGVLGFILFVFCEPLSYLLTYTCLINKLVKSPMTSIYEWVCYFYGNGIKVIFIIGELVANFLFVSVNICIIKNILEALGLPYAYNCLVILVFTLVVIIDSLNDNGENNSLIISLVKSLILLVIPFICVFIIIRNCSDQASIGYIYSCISYKMNIFNLSFFTGDLFIYIAMFVRFIFPFVDSEIYNSTVQDKLKDNNSSFIVSFLSVMFYSFFIVATGLIMFCLNQNLEENDILGFFLHITDHYIFHSFFILTCFYFVFHLSVSIIKSLSNLMVNDFFSIILAPNLNIKTLNKICVIFIGFISCFIAMLDIDPIDLFFYSSCGNFPVLVVPITLTILGFKTHKNCIYISVIAGLSASFIFTLFTLNTQYCKFAFFPGMIGNIVCLLVSHLYYVYFKNFKFAKMDIAEVISRSNENIVKEKIDSLLNISRKNLLLRMKSIINDKKDLSLNDEQIFKSYIDNDFIKAQLEYKIYKVYVYRFIIKKDISSHNSKEFIDAVNKDAKNLLEKSE